MQMYRDAGAGRVSCLEYLAKCYGISCARRSEAWQISVNRCKGRLGVGDERPMTTIPGSSRRPVSTSAISTGSRRGRRRERCTIRCSRCIRTASIPLRCGGRRAIKG